MAWIILSIVLIVLGVIQHSWLYLLGGLAGIISIILQGDDPIHR